MTAATPPRFALPPAAGFLLKFAVFTGAYIALARLTQLWMSADGVIGLFWPTSGLALGVVLKGGRRYLPAVFIAQLLTNLAAGMAPAAALLTATGNALETLTGIWLLTRVRPIDQQLSTLRDYLVLALMAGLLAPAASAIIGVGTLLYFGHVSADGILINLQHWWLANTLGIGLVTPLVLLWRRPVFRQSNWPQGVESATLLGLTFLSGQIIYFDWFGYNVLAQQFPHDLTFALVIWAAVRTGHRTVSAMLCLTALQMMIGTHRGLGYYAELLEINALNAWFHLMSLSLVGMSIATYVVARRRSDLDLRIAATAFECQEGMIITDAQRRILRTNHSFSRITGYSNEEVVGKTTEFMRSPRHPAAFYREAWETAKREGQWADEVWHQRKNGEVFPQWLTCTAVTNARGEITNYVVTHMDITVQKQQQAELQAAEAAHRDALIREVHHRIKNNLQGITGMLRQFAQEHPELAGPVNQAIGQVRSVAVIHGLQGRASLQTVRLCELTSAIAGDIATLWHVPVHVDIPERWVPGVVTESEAVPVALVLNELILNAVKHGGQAHGHIDVILRKGLQPDSIQVDIRNPGRWRARASHPDAHRNGLQLIDALLPRAGARLSTEQQFDMVQVRLELAPPVITLESKELS